MNKKYIIAAMATSFALNMNAQSVKVTVLSWTATTNQLLEHTSR